MVIQSFSGNFLDNIIVSLFKKLTISKIEVSVASMILKISSILFDVSVG